MQLKSYRAFVWVYFYLYIDPVYKKRHAMLLESPNSLCFCAYIIIVCTKCHSIPFSTVGHFESDVTMAENLENVSKSNVEQDNEVGRFCLGSAECKVGEG